MDFREKIELDRRRCADQARWCKHRVTRAMQGGNLLSLVQNYVQMVRFTSEARALRRALDYVEGEDPAARSQREY